MLGGGPRPQVGSDPESGRRSRQAWRSLARSFRRASELTNELVYCFNYHLHDSSTRSPPSCTKTTTTTTTTTINNNDNEEEDYSHNNTHNDDYCYGIFIMILSRTWHTIWESSNEMLSLFVCLCVSLACLFASNLHFTWSNLLALVLHNTRQLSLLIRFLSLISKALESFSLEWVSYKSGRVALDCVRLLFQSNSALKPEDAMSHR